MKKKDLILIACMFAAGLLLFVFLMLFKGSGTYASVQVNGREISRYSLNKNVTIQIEGYDGGNNLLVIRDGTAYIEEASCPDKLCVHQGKVQKEGQLIICLPNRVVIEIIGGQKSGFDFSA